MSPICIHCDSQYVIGKEQNSMYNGKSRNIHCRHDTIRQLLSTRVISLDYVRSKDNIVDPLIKRLNRELVEKSLRVVNTMDTQPSRLEILRSRFKGITKL